MLSTLNVSQSGLTAARIAVENVSNNLANENTPGYKKRVVQLDELSQIDSRFTGRGVSASSTYRVTSQYMYDKMISENTKSNYYDKLSNMMGSVESIFAETEGSGFSSDLNRYFQSIENLRTNPNSEIYKSSLKSSGTIIVDSLQNLYASVEKQQSAEKTELGVNVDRVNGILKEIGSLNEKLEKYDGVSNDLLDKRDALELELSNYADISTGNTNGYYELKISGETVISNNTNVRTLSVLEEKTPQIDKFNNIKYNNDNTYKIYDSIKYNNNFTSKNIDTADVITYKLNNAVEVSVTIGGIIPDVTQPKNEITGEYPPLDINGDGDPKISEDELIRALVFKINTNADTKNLVTAYNGDYSLDSNGNKVINNTKDNFLRIESKFTGIDNQFNGEISIEKKAKNLDVNDIVTYKITNDLEVSVTLGEYILDKTQPQVNGVYPYADFNDDGTPDLVSEDNILRALVLKMNTDPNSDIQSITAYNGDVTDSNAKDHFIRLDTPPAGYIGTYSIVKSDSNPADIDVREAIYKNDIESTDPESKVSVGIYDKEITLKSGMLKAQVDNLSSDSSNNKFQSYLDKLNSFAQTLSDISDKYIKTGANDYIYGDAESSNSLGTITSINLFTGSSVKSLIFNQNSVNDLDQNKLDYLATLQWKTDLSFDGLGQENDNSTKSISLLEFFRELRVGISADKENTDFLKETQNSVKQSLENSYNQLTKVDQDEEMLNLIKFQAAYTANAKMITVIDDMLQTLLGLKR